MFLNSFYLKGVEHQIQGACDLTDFSTKKDHQRVIKKFLPRLEGVNVEDEKKDYRVYGDGGGRFTLIAPPQVAQISGSKNMNDGVSVENRR